MHSVEPQLPDYHPLQDSTLDWDKLGELDDKPLQWLARYQVLHKEGGPNVDKALVSKNLEKYLQQRIDDGRPVDQIRAIAPKFADYIEAQHKALEKTRPLNIDWFSADLKADWQALRKIDHPDVKWMVQFYELGQEKREAKDRAFISKSITRLASQAAKDKALGQKLGKIAPKLAIAIKSQSVSKPKDRGMEREY